MNFKNFGLWDIGLTKLAVFSATLFLISLWSGFANWVMNTHWAWFLIIALVAAIKPVMASLKK